MEKHLEKVDLDPKSHTKTKLKWLHGALDYNYNLRCFHIPLYLIVPLILTLNPIFVFLHQNYLKRQSVKCLYLYYV